ncbi:hypothetical protein [Oribacterium sp. Sow4_G1_1]|uniref:hypothetical protein n=1 Tax=Oribacterium sp. Sow4_G1_1 TaxID=3438794 RepID=UPI003F9A7B3E
MTKEKMEALAKAAAMITEAKKEISEIALEEAKWGLITLPGNVDHAEMCLSMTVAVAKAADAKKELKRALELADLCMQAGTVNDAEKRERLGRLFDKMLELEREQRN